MQVSTFGVFGFMEFLSSFLFSRAMVNERICNHGEWYKNVPVEQVMVIIPLHDTMPKSSMSHILLCFVECFNLVPQKHAWQHGLGNPERPTSMMGVLDIYLVIVTDNN